MHVFDRKKKEIQFFEIPICGFCHTRQQEGTLDAGMRCLYWDVVLVDVMCTFPVFTCSCHSLRRVFFAFSADASHTKVKMPFRVKNPRLGI